MPKRRVEQHSEEFWNNASDFVYYWRKNIHRFIIEVLGIELKPFQELAVYEMSATYVKTLNTFIFFASRGVGKTFLTAVWVIAMCILYPRLKIRTSSYSLDQAKLVIEKIRELRDKYPSVAREIDKLNFQKDYAYVKFKNEAQVEIVVCGERARGNRCNILVLDESRKMIWDDINTFLTPFMTGLRDPAYNPKKHKSWMKEYKREHNTIIFLTSIGYKNEWSYREFETAAQYIAHGRDDYAIMSIPYQIGVKEDIITEDYIAYQLRNSKSNLKIFKMEMEVIPYGLAEDSLFDYSQLARQRNIYAPLFPLSDFDYDICKGDPTSFSRYVPKIDGEIRVLVFDIAYAMGSKNDNSVIGVIRCLAADDHYHKSVSYIEVMNGKTIDEQAVRVKDVFYDLECDYAVVDIGGPGGIAMLGVLGNTTVSPIRCTRYPGWKTCNDDKKYDAYIKDPKAEPVLYPFHSSQANIHFTLKTLMDIELERRYIQFLVGEKDAIDYLNDKYDYMKLSTGNYREREQAENLIVSFANTDEMISEAMTTKLVKTRTGKFTFDEGAGRKDRIVCVLYGVYFIVNYLETKLQSQKRAVDTAEYFKNAPQTKRVVNPFVNNLSKLQGFGARR